MKKVIAAIAILMIGILIGFGIGMPIGIQFARQQSETVMPQVTGTPSPVPTVTSEPTALSTPSPTPMLSETPEPTTLNTPSPTPMLSETPEPTSSSTPIPAPSVTPMPTAPDMPSPTPTAIPTPTATSTLTPAPSVTLTPTATSTPIPMPTAIPKPTATSTPTPAPSVIPTPTATSTLIPVPSAKPTAVPTKVPVDTESKEEFPGALHVEGTHLATEEGTLIQLRGVSTHGLGWFPAYVNDGMIAQAKQEWGCNVFRLAMYTAEYNGYCTSGNGQKENLKRIIDDGVRAAVKQGMYVMIDWHILSDSNPNTYKNEAKQFFAEMAEKYADVPNVIYEICNEPNGGTNWSTIRQYAMEIIPVIREYAPEAVIIVGTPTWSQDVDVAAENPITEYDNIMYALHFYADTHRDSLRNKCKAAVAKGLPLFVTEYGICDASGSGQINEAEADKWMELLDSLGISHVMWNLSNKSETSAMIQSGSNKVNNLTDRDLSPAGKWFVNRMKEAGLGSEEWVLPEDLAEDTAGNGNQPGSSDHTQNSAGNTQDNSEAGNNNTPTAPESLSMEDIFELPTGITFESSNSWVTESGFGMQINVVIKNSGAEEENDWLRNIAIKEGINVTLSQCWCAKARVEGNVLTLTSEEYNKNIPAGGEISGIGLIMEVN